MALEHHADAPLLGLLPGDVLTGHPHLTAIHRVSPASARSRVDLPQPEGPSRVTSSPCGCRIQSLEHLGVAVGFVQLIHF